MTPLDTTTYTDIQGLAGLRAAARSAPAENSGEVAAQFESIFVQMMLKSMRDASIDGELFSSNALDSYQQMFDQQISLDLSRSGGLGLAEILAEQLNQAPLASTPQNQAGQQQGQSLTQLDAQRQMRSLSWVESGLAKLPPVAASAAAARADGLPATAPKTPSSPAEFVRANWRHAVAAADKLGVDPAVLLAQSALETGWGRHVIKGGDGQTSHNLFGIKAGRNWDGKSATVSTLEYRDGVAARERAVFRAYESPAAAFEDYVNLLQGSPRYQDALSSGVDNRAFLTNLQRAGYATDPAYADKILQILGGDDYASLVGELKNSAEMPLSG